MYNIWVKKKKKAWRLILCFTNYSIPLIDFFLIIHFKPIKKKSSQPKKKKKERKEEERAMSVKRRIPS